MIELSPELRVHFGAPQHAGLMISKVEDDSPAARADIAVGDILIAVNGKQVDAIWVLHRKVSDKKAGDKIDLKLVRNKKTHDVRVTLAERERPVVDVSRFFGWPLSTDLSMLGIPVSTSTAIVGAVVGVGLVKGMKAISKKTLMVIIAGWVLTPALAALSAFLMYKTLVLWLR